MNKKSILTAVLCFVLLVALVAPSCSPAAASNLPQLYAPMNLRVEDARLLWDPAENAASYQVEFRDEIFSTTECEYPLPEIIDYGSYLVRVKAVAVAGYLDSPWVKTTYTVQAPTEGLQFTMLKDGSGYTVSRQGLNPEVSGELVIPDYYNGLPVVGVEDVNPQTSPVAFPNFKGITSIKLSKFLQYVGDYAFAGFCIKSVILPQGLQEIGVGSFSQTRYLTQINFPSSVKLIQDYAFEGSSIYSAVLPEGLISLGSAFQSCYFLDTVVIPSTVTQIPAKTFWQCYHLKYVTLSSSVTYMGDEAFGFGSGAGYFGEREVTFVEHVIYFTYSGTYTQWFDIEIPENWRNGREDFCDITCTDAKIRISYAGTHVIPNEGGPGFYV